MSLLQKYDRVAEGFAIEQGDFTTYAPAEPVDATIVLRALYLVDDRVEVLRRIGDYTRVKLVFEVSPRQLSLERSGPVARLVAARRFRVFCAASRSA